MIPAEKTNQGNKYIDRKKKINISEELQQFERKLLEQTYTKESRIIEISENFE